jgi:hypothetical protein
MNSLRPFRENAYAYVDDWTAAQDDKFIGFALFIVMCRRILGYQLNFKAS